MTTARLPLCRGSFRAVDGRFGFFEHEPGTRFTNAGSRSLPSDGHHLIPHEEKQREWDDAFYAFQTGNHRRAAFSKDAATQFAMGFRAAVALEDSRNTQHPSKSATWSAKRIEQFLTPGKKRTAISRQQAFVKAAEPIIKLLVAENCTPTIERLLSELSISGWLNPQDDLSPATVRKWLQHPRLVRALKPGSIVFNDLGAQ